MGTDTVVKKMIFQSTPPVKAATCSLLYNAEDCCISIHAAREGGDAVRMVSQPVRYISIHAAREGGDLCIRFRYPLIRISIHAAREGGDDVGMVFQQCTLISIHAAREGGDGFIASASA